MSRFLSYVRLIWVVFIVQLKQMAVDSFVIFIVIVQPLFIALLAIYMLRGSAGFQAIYVIVGSALTGLWSGTLFFCGHNIDAERWSGTLESIIGSPSPLAIVIVGKSLANVTLSLSSMLFSYPLAAWLFGFSLQITQPWSFVISLALTIPALVSLGLVIAPLLTLSPGSSMWLNSFEFPVYIAAGFLFPIALLPGWTTPFSYLLSPYWAARALHDTSSGQVPLDHMTASWSILLLLCLIYVLISMKLFAIVLRRARQDATLGMQ